MNAESSQKKSAYQVALDQLARRERSVAELEATLKRKGFELDEVQAAVKRVVELGYLNEERLAGAIIRDARAAGRGPRVAWMKLRQKGVGGWSLERVTELWREGGSPLPETPAEPEIEVARAFVERRFARVDLADPKAQRRALGALLRRGFSLEIAKRVIQAK